MFKKSNWTWEKTKKLKQFHAQAVKESWCGESFLKFNYDLKLSQFPIIKAYDLTKAEAIVEKDITTAIIFKSWFNKNSKRRRSRPRTAKRNSQRFFWSFFRNTIFKRANRHCGGVDRGRPRDWAGLRETRTPPPSETWPDATTPLREKTCKN